MAVTIPIPYRVSGLTTVYLVLRRRLDGWFLSALDGTFAAAPATYPYLIESTIRYQSYEAAALPLNDGLYDFAAYVRQGAAQDRQIDIPASFGTLLVEDGVDVDEIVKAKDATAASILSAVRLSGLYTVTVQLYRTATVTPIPDVLCDVYDSTETTRLNGTQIKSDVNGQISFSRDNGTYKVRAMLAGFTFTTGTVVVADGNATLTMYGAAVTIPNPPVAGTQTLYGNVRELDWGVATGDAVTAIIADKGQVVNGALIQYLNLSTTVDANSQFSLTVPKGAVIRLTVKDHGTHEFTINNEDTYDVATYLTE